MSVNKTASHFFLITMLGALFCAPLTALAQAEATPAQAAVAAETLLREAIEGVPDKEVIVSRVSFPAHTQLPWHWHPGEEFIYVLEGSATIWQEGKEDISGGAGDLIKIPLKQVHTGMTGEEGVRVIVFRVHEEGKPERVKVE